MLANKSLENSKSEDQQQAAPRSTPKATQLLAWEVVSPRGGALRDWGLQMGGRQMGSSRPRWGRWRRQMSVLQMVGKCRENHH